MQLFTFALCALRFPLVAFAVFAMQPVNVTQAENPAFKSTSPLIRKASSYRFRRWLRERVYDPADDARYGLAVADDLSHFEETLPLVIQVHGFNSSCERNLAVIEPFQAAGFPCGGFAYPNDHSLAESAQRMSRELKSLARAHPYRQLVLVTHSMGALVARACIEDGALNPGNVDKLLMIAPPSQGTLVARFAVATDVWEHWLGRPEGDAWTRWRDSVVDGLGEAADDLLPGSPFLVELNGRRRNPLVDYTIFLGTDAAMKEAEMEWIRTSLRKTSGRVPGLRRCTQRLESTLAEMDELVQGKGDGVVAVKRGRLAGVDDVVILPFGHLSVTGPADSTAVRQVQQELLSRIE